MNKRVVFISLFAIVLASLYSSYSTANGKSSLFYRSQHDEYREVAFKRSSGTTVQIQDNSTTLSRFFSSLSNQTSVWFSTREDPSKVTTGVRPNRTQTVTDTNAATTTMTDGSNETLSILVQLSGEMGNNLDKIGHGICLQEWLREEFNTHSTLYLRHQTVPKWVKGYRNLNKCFPWTRQFDFSAGNTLSIDNLLSDPPDWWDAMMKVGTGNVSEIRRGLQFTVDAWRSWKQCPNNRTTATLSDGTVLTTPFIYSNAFINRHPCLDRYYDVIRSRFEFNRDACCGKVSDANETVFVSDNSMAVL